MRRGVSCGRAADLQCARPTSSTLSIICTASGWPPKLPAHNVCSQYLSGGRARESEAVASCCVAPKASAQGARGHPHSTFRDRSTQANASERLPGDSATFLYTLTHIQCMYLTAPAPSLTRSPCHSMTCNSNLKSDLAIVFSAPCLP